MLWIVLHLRDIYRQHDKSLITVLYFQTRTPHVCVKPKHIKGRHQLT